MVRKLSFGAQRLLLLSKYIPLTASNAALASFWCGCSSFKTSTLNDLKSFGVIFRKNLFSISEGEDEDSTMGVKPSDFTSSPLNQVNG